MHRSFVITEEEKNRILGIHEQATKRQYLSEQLYQRSVNDGTNISTEIVDANGKFVRMFDMSKGDDKLQDFNTAMYQKANPTKGNQDAKKPNTNKKMNYSPKTMDEILNKTALLVLNSKGDVVKQVQDMLVKINKLKQGSYQQGTYDQATKNAVIAFQNEKKGQLKPDGIVGSKTLPLLQATAETQFQAVQAKDNKSDNDVNITGDEKNQTSDKTSQTPDKTKSDTTTGNKTGTEGQSTVLKVDPNAIASALQSLQVPSNEQPK